MHGCVETMAAQVEGEQPKTAADVEKREFRTAEQIAHGVVERIAAELAGGVAAVRAEAEKRGDRWARGFHGWDGFAVSKGLRPRASSHGKRSRNPQKSRRCIQVSSTLSRR